MRKPFGLVRRKKRNEHVEELHLVVHVVEETVENEPTGDMAGGPTVKRAPVDSYRGKGRLGRLPQCPECGRFRLQMQREESLYVFDCADCRANWTWAINRPWPRTTALPDVKRTFESPQTNP